jgi:hypothetical protein
VSEQELWVKNGLRQSKAEPFGGLLPAFQFRFLKEDTRNGLGTGKTVSCRNSRKDLSFQDHGEIIYDW